MKTTNILPKKLAQALLKYTSDSKAYIAYEDELRKEGYATKDGVLEVILSDFSEFNCALDCEVIPSIRFFYWRTQLTWGNEGEPLYSIYKGLYNGKYLTLLLCDTKKQYC